MTATTPQEDRMSGHTPTLVAAEAWLHAIVDAWESLPGGRQVRNADVEVWLAEDMAPAINNIRGFLRRPRPDGITPPAPVTAIDDHPTRELVAALVALAKGYQEWEASIVLEGDWSDEMPKLTQEQYDEMMRLQADRNAALQLARENGCEA